jgi:hypothetical protein
MSNKNRNKKVEICLMVAAICVVVAGLWAILATPEIARAEKPSGGGQPEVLHGAAEFMEDSADYAVRSDGLGPYVDGVDFTDLGLEGFFRLRIHLKNNAGRKLDLTFPEGISPDFFPTTQNIWILGLNGNLADWRAQTEGVPVLRMGNLLIGQTGKDEAGISYGRWGPDGEGEKGDLLTVTRTGTDVWTIESLATDSARFYRQTGKGWTWYELAPMPFQVTYYGQ